MIYFIFFFILFVLLALLFHYREKIFFLKRELIKKTKQGLFAIVSGRRRLKEERKGKIIAYIQERGEITNEKACELLKVSERTVVNYMDELEKEGKIVQEGKTGRGVKYTFHL